jgi:hypothetical protein
VALITAKKLIKKESNNHKVHGAVSSTYFVFPENATDPRQKILQIDTYGSINRVNQGKTSQSMQFDYESAKIFYELLVKEFDF